MAIEGIWTLSLSTPMGRQQVRLDLSREAGKLTGTASLGADSAPMADLTEDGDRLRWSVDITKPMKMTVKFEVTCAGESLRGTAKLGFLASAEVVGAKEPS